MPWGLSAAAAPLAAQTLPGMMFRGFQPPPSQAAAGAPPSMPSLINPDLTNATEAKPSFFGRGGGWQDVVGGIADALAGRPIYQTAQRDQRQHDYEMQQFRMQAAQQQAQRDQDRQWQQQNWLQQQIWKQSHPDDEFTQYITAAGIDPQSDQGRNLYRQRAESMAAPPLVSVDGFDPQGNQTKTFYPRTAFGGGGGQPAPAGPPVGTVRNGFRFQGGNPKDRNSWVPVGGASSSGGATFR